MKTLEWYQIQVWDRDNIILKFWLMHVEIVSFYISNSVAYTPNGIILMNLNLSNYNIQFADFNLNTVVWVDTE